LISWQTPRFRLREDRIGDGAYYLGFLYTLVSLSYALYQFTEVGGVEGVISGFGVALVTTIVGLSLRVLFQQLREDPIEIEQEVRRTLSDEVGRLERELRLSVESMIALRNRVDQELAKAVGTGLERILRDSREAMKADTAAFKEAIETTLSGVKDAVTASMTVAAETRKSTGRLLKAVEALAERIDQTKPPTEGFRDKIDEFTATLDRMLTREAGRIEKTAESADAILGIYREMETRSLEAAATMEQCKAAVEGLRASMGCSTAAAKEMADSARTVTDDLLERNRRQIDLLQRVEQMSEESEKFLRSLRGTLESQVQMSAGALALLERHVVQAAGLVVRELDAK
jgi:methyl-accepting chemotaxis protein